MSETSPSESASHHGWLAANGALVALMVAAVALIWTAESEAWNWLPRKFREGVFWIALIGGPIGLVLCWAAVYKIDKYILDRRLKVILIGMNLVGILIGFSSFVLWFFWLMFAKYSDC